MKLHVNKQCYKKGVLLFLLSFFFIGTHAYAKTDKCKNYQKKYQSILVKQRQSNSNKRSNSLKEQANKAFKQWQRCKQGK